MPLNRNHEGTVRFLRTTDDGPVWGVRLQLRCPCGFTYGQTFIVNVDRPYTHCLRCGNRTRLRLVWSVNRPVEEGQRVRITPAADR